MTMRKTNKTNPISRASPLIPGSPSIVAAGARSEKVVPSPGWGGRRSSAFKQLGGVGRNSTGEAQAHPVTGAASGRAIFSCTADRGGIVAG